MNTTERLVEFYKEQIGDYSIEDQLLNSCFETSGCKPLYSFQQEEVECLLYQSPLLSNWSDRNESGRFVCRENNMVDTDIATEREELEYWPTPASQTDFESYVQEEDITESCSFGNPFVEDSPYCTTARAQCYQLEDWSEESKESNLTGSLDCDGNRSPIRSYLQKDGKLSLLLNSSRNSSHSNSLFENKSMEEYSQSSDNNYVKSESLETDKDFVKYGPWIRYLDSPQYHDVTSSMHMTKRKRRSKVPPKDLLEQDASVLYGPTRERTRDDMKSYRMAALGRYYYKKSRRNYAKRVRYECRKRLAVYRPRLFGRFIKTSCPTPQCNGNVQ